jgi:hypothetical protein
MADNETVIRELPSPNVSRGLRLAARLPMRDMTVCQLRKTPHGRLFFRGAKP